MNLLKKIASGIVVPSLILGLVGIVALPMTASAATTPSLGAADTYAILSNTYTNTTAGTTVNGDIGFTTGPAVAPGGTQANYGSGAPYATAGIDQGNALAALAAEPCTFTFAPGPINLSTDTTHGPIGVYTPGVYCSTGAMDIGGALTLSGSGTYIFRPDGAFTSTAGAVVTLAGASVCDVFWTPTAATTLAANTTFQGTIIDDAGITVGANTTWTGRALAFNGTVTTDTNTISAPSCAAPPAPAPAPSPTTPPLINVRKVPSPLALPAGPGPVTYTYTLTNPGTITMNNITLVDDQCSNTVYVSGDVNGNGYMETAETWLYTCTTTLNQTTVNYATARGVGNDMAAVDTAIAQVIVGVPVVPPLINIVKTPSTFNLDFGGAVVNYNYVVTNPGTVALNNVTVTDDRCGGVTYVSGDVNSNGSMEVSETWRYTCSTNVPVTTTNTAVATGEANGLTAVDTSLATVVVAGSPLPPPLILLTKRASPVLLPASGGLVTYTLTVTNPGTVALNDVSVSDNNCGVVTFVSGDVNGNSLLETSETWTYTCQQNLTASTTNTATASGFGNGLIVSSIAVASVPLSPALIPPAPILPVTGFGPGNNSFMWMVASIAIFLVAGGLLAFTQWKRRF